jgi:CRISPR-associated protein Csm4
MKCIIRLKFTTPLHISNQRSDYSVSETLIHSDTLYSAIINAWSNLGLTTYIPSNTGSIFPFALSSLFPYVNLGGEYVYFLPRPACFNQDVPIELNKDFKKIEYIESSYFKLLQQGEKIAIEKSIIKSNLLTNKAISFPLYTKSEQPRVRVSRSFESAEPFYIERIFFHENAGLYFILHYEDEKILEPIQYALDYLKDEGIGTDRNVGNGKFTWEFENNSNIIHFDNVESSYSTNLSLYIPENHQTISSLMDEGSYFGFITRGGWITSYPYLSLRKKYIRAVKEGSVLKIAQGISGRIADITPDRDKLPDDFKNIHTIFRVGKAIWVPIKA